MIEKYFKAGIRFKWTKPNDQMGPTSGAIVESTQEATPLIYDGLDGNLLDPTLRLQHTSTLGLTMRMPIQYQWLDYAPGRTARRTIGPYDVLTGYMSGCIIAFWTDRGVNYVGHVGTIDGNAGVNRTVKRAFGAAMNASTKGFNPAGAWNDAEIQALSNQFKGGCQERIFGLVTTSGNFFSVLMLKINPGVGVAGNEWCAAGVKSVPPIQHGSLQALMNAP